MRAFSMVMVVLLAGCATKPVQVPVTVLCKTPAIGKPDFYYDHVTKDMSLFDKVKLLIADRKQRQGYEVELESAVNVCQ